MQSAVIAIVVAHNGAPFLSKTMAAVRAENPGTLIVVDTGSRDESLSIMTSVEPDRLVSVSASTTFGEAIRLGLAALGRPVADYEWLWLLHDDSSPLPGALSQLQLAVEQNPNVSIVGPKQTAWGEQHELVEYGLTMTRFGTSVSPAAGELDQAQFDTESDVMAVGTAGMLINGQVWYQLGGLDPALAFMDDGLDLGVRARLAGGRVIKVPGAKVEHAQGVDRRNRSYDRQSTFGASRRGHYYRHLVYAPAWFLPLSWLLMLPTAVIRSLGYLFAKQPQKAPIELAAALSALFSFGNVAAGRRRLAQSKLVGWKSLKPLRLSWSEHRRIIASRKEQVNTDLVEKVDPTLTKTWFWGSPAPWIIGIATVVSVLIWNRLLGASSVVGGGSGILSDSVSSLWNNAIRDSESQLFGHSVPPDPINSIWAALGTVTFWNPSFSLVLLLILALPLAAFGGYTLCRRFTAQPLLHIAGAVAWAVAPPFLEALSQGRIGAVIAHLALPFCAYLLSMALSPALNRSQSITALSGSALLAALVTAVSPMTGGLIVIIWLVLVAANPQKVGVLGWLPAPLLVILIPAGIHLAMTGNWWPLAVEPGGAVAVGSSPSWLHLFGVAITEPAGLTSLASWLGEQLSLSPSTVVYVALALACLTGGFLLVTAVGLLGSRHHWQVATSLIVFAISTVFAVAATNVQVGSVGGQITSAWVGPVLSVAWLALIIAVVRGLDSVAKTSRIVAPLFVTLGLLLVAPWAVTTAMGGGVVQASDGQTTPAIVQAESAVRPEIRMLTIELLEAPVDEPVVFRAEILPGQGETLDERSSWQTGQRELSQQQVLLAQVVGDLVSVSSASVREQLQQWNVEYVLLVGEPSAAVEAAQATLTANTELSVIGPSEFGQLWRVNEVTAVTMPVGEINWAVIVAQASVLLVFGLLAIPTSRYPRVYQEQTGSLTQPVAGDVDDD